MKQHGFRKQKLTPIALLQLTDKILCNLHQLKITGVVSLNLTKAFDTEIVLVKLYKVIHHYNGSSLT